MSSSIFVFSMFNLQRAEKKKSTHKSIHLSVGQRGAAEKRKKGWALRIKFSGQLWKDKGLRHKNRTVPLREEEGEKTGRHLRCVCVCVCAQSLSLVQLFPTPWTVCSPPGSSVQAIFQARILEWVAISFSSSVIQCCPFPNPKSSLTLKSALSKAHSSTSSPGPSTLFQVLIPTSSSTKFSFSPNMLSPLQPQMAAFRTSVLCGTTGWRQNGCLCSPWLLLEILFLPSFHKPTD